MLEKIKLINHSSLYMNFKDELRILTDPWYDGTAFDGGWSLLHENNCDFIFNILEKVDYIYITHEHPDHFSISFFKKYSEIINKKKIKILFQETSDKRVENFLSKKFNLDIIVLKNYETIKLNKHSVTLISCGAIDSSLIVETDNCYHINLNDCDFLETELKKIKKLLTNKKKIIIYLQFSYAAYRSDDEWLKKAAKFKLRNLVNVYKIFDADLIIPFASFVYFSNAENFRLNKYMNNVQTTSEYLNQKNIKHCFLNPDLSEIKINDIIDNKLFRQQTINNSISFWDKKFENIQIKKEINKKYLISEEIIQDFILRIKKNNSVFLLFLIRLLSFKYFFGDIIVYLSDTEETYKINFFKIVKIKTVPKSKVEIEMMSRRFFFLIKQPYGIDTLSSNGCLKELKKNSFEKMIRSLGFISLNQTNNGINIKSILSRNILHKILSIFIRLKLKNS